MTNINEIQVTKTIVNEFLDDFIQNILDSDVVVVGSGPCGVAAAKYAAELGHKTVMIERNIYGGGGMWQGGYLMPKNTVAAPANKILQECGVNLKDAGNGLYVCDSFEMVSKMLASACDAGVKLLNSTNVEDIILKEDHVEGVVIQWYPVQQMPKFITCMDPIAIRSKVVIDATGHDSFLVKRLVDQRDIIGVKKPIPGCGSLWVDEAEKQTVELTHEIYPGLIVAGMSATSTYGAPRMGPIFGGMLLAGKKAAELAHEKIMGIKVENVGKLRVPA
ncbi:sulfide-dependent adenosine diphosphate thiazole synthase [Candidatus Methanoperedens nitratireducens]|uniref:Thiamine thiazole synthase n=1 Tax=Candidatus Methanoperedens nitratireducens TaxID=1392998 RepID=A0A284VPW9_9EURY|nr:sulfide-dependent adenosine diphosphate thiazole synthase [Candidatus Methanoperedens nitroreducens]SNQ61269.1 putative ribose 1,5-bisphosphate isomerase [Candidatus Methanoperedens nitroreducens]